MTNDSIYDDARRFAKKYRMTTERALDYLRRHPKKLQEFRDYIVEEAEALNERDEMDAERIEGQRAEDYFERWY